MSAKGKETQVNRRSFLKTQTAVLGAAALVGSSRSLFAAGDDKIRIAVIGCGGRGNGAGADNLSACENTEIVAVADAFEDKAKGAASRWKVAPEKTFWGLDAYKKAIDADIDMIITATPPGFRPLHLQGRHRSRQARLHGKALLRGRTGLPDPRRSQQAGRRERSQSRRGTAAPPRRRLCQRHQENPRRQVRRSDLPAGLLERRWHLVARPPGRLERDDGAGQQLVPLQLAQRRQHLRAARPQLGRLQLGEERAAGRSERHGRK